MMNRKPLLGLVLAAGLALPGTALADDDYADFVRAIIAQQFSAPWFDHDIEPRRSIHRMEWDDDDDDDRQWRRWSRDEDNDDDDD